MYAELGSPDYGGVMQVEPKYITVQGQPAVPASSIPHSPWNTGTNRSTSRPR